MKKLYVDDIRDAPDSSWDIARNYRQAIHMLETNNYDVVSLDHDLGDFDKDTKREYTGYDILLWIVERKEAGLTYPADVRVHTANVPAGFKMRSTIARYFK